MRQQLMTTIKKNTKVVCLQLSWDSGLGANIDIREIEINCKNNYQENIMGSNATKKLYVKTVLL